MFYETMKNIMSLFIVETSGFNYRQQVMHEGVPGRCTHIQNKENEGHGSDEIVNFISNIKLAIFMV